MMPLRLMGVPDAFLGEEVGAFLRQPKMEKKDSDICVPREKWLL